MGFYEELSRYYDIIFPAAPSTVEFIEKSANDRKYILDIACGTGNYAIELAKKGYIVDGVDLDSEMIKAGKKKAKAENLNINFTQGNMKDIKALFSDQKYDLIYCIGNSLVHLDSEDEIGQLINDISDITNDNGTLVIQIINYDRILDFNIDHLPTISRKEAGVEFVRNYVHDKVSGKILFNTEIHITNEDKTHKYENSVALFPLRKDALVNIVKNAGFNKIEVYGGFGKEEYFENSFATVLVARK
ncbi:methyltransferase type 11 [Proteiniborus sp. DW1]|uniref:class I SAM-dependent methyltransferase n=1 Tax=Proteiniborus sp. DW1 TaxID=1889883 RepID=UPI00092E127D|nr:class I SAM-dependent methyltransferase [Proteiniborus sp. DW1]SCG81946.1 methyltransferase type 11 [Proteiniborus sp. DW1]